MIRVRYTILAFLLLLFWGLSPLGAQSHVYVGNQQMLVDPGSGSVSVIHFIRLLAEEERKRVSLEGSSLLVIDGKGLSRQFPLDEARRLQNWREVLDLLGYVRKENSQTGVVDYKVAMEELKLLAPEAPAESLALREERSMRRPGYRKAKQNYEAVLDKMGRSKNEKARQRVDRLGQLVAEQSPLSGILWKFDVIDTAVPNALCTGEGHVIVTTGLLDLDLSDDELAGVLGHEVAHGVRRHAQIYEERFGEYVTLSNEMMKLSQEYSAAVDSGSNHQIQRLRSRVGEMQKRYDFVVDYLKNRQDYNQDEEEEADVLGMQYAVSAGFDSEGEARALIKLKKRSVQLFGQSYDAASRTHPPLDRRLKILETVRARWRQDLRR